MTDFMNSAAIGRLEEYYKRIGGVLDNQKQRESFATYTMGLLGEGERKSVEPMACRGCPDPTRADAEHQRLLHFITNMKWSDRDVRLSAAQYAIDAMTEHEPIEVSILDDTGFLKQGSHSVGVQRQYTGSAGKITNCQIGVSLSVATRTEHVPIDFQLYLPESWMNDLKRRTKARIPADMQFKTKPELALEMIRQAVADKIPLGVVLADSAYGTSSVFRDGVRTMGLDYAVGVDPKTTVWLLDADANSTSEKISVRDYAFCHMQNGGFRRCTWRSGTRNDLTAKFAARRVMAVTDNGRQEALWLLIEWRNGETEPANYFLSSLPASMTKKRLIRIVMQRWRTERVYEDLKGELGLDHYEGRRYPGWHHHVSCALSCYAFIVAERVRRFSPSAGRSAEDLSFQIAA